MKNKIFHEWLLKLVSVICAVVIWFVIYDYNDPEETRTYRNVKVTLVNTDRLTKDNKVFEVLDKTDVISDIQLKAKHSILKDIDRSDLNVIADFEDYKEAKNSVEIKISSSRHNDDIDIISSSNQLLLRVEDIVEKEFVVEVLPIDSLQDGYIIEGTLANPDSVKVTGAQSLVENVDKVAAEIAVADVSGDAVVQANLALYDKEGKAIEDDRLTFVDNPTVYVDLDVYVTKTLPIKYIALGTTAEGFAVVGDATSEVSEIQIAGKKDKLAELTEIVVAGDALSFENVESDVMVSVDIADYLPEGVRLTQNNGLAEVLVKISPIIEKEFVLQMNDVVIENVPEEYDKVVHVEEKADFKVVLSGAELILDSMDEDDILAKVDIKKWMEARNVRKLRKDATYKIKPDYEVPAGTLVVSDNFVEVMAKMEE